MNLSFKIDQTDIRVQMSGSGKEELNKIIMEQSRELQNGSCHLIIERRKRAGI
jgi:hypothetical protein